MITNTYNKGRFPNKVETLQDIAAEEVARQVGMEYDVIRGDPLVYAQAMSDPALSIGMLEARKKAFSNYSRQVQMRQNKIDFQQGLRQISEKSLPWTGLTPKKLRAHIKRKADAFSPEAIHHAAEVDWPASPQLLHIQTPAERLEFDRMPFLDLPAEFVQFVRDKLHIEIESDSRGDVHDAIWERYDTTPEAAWTVIVQLWQEWSKSQIL